MSERLSAETVPRIWRKRCCIDGCEEPVATWVNLRIFDMTMTKQVAKRPFCEGHRPALIDGRDDA